MNCPFSWNAGSDEDALAHFLVARRDARAAGFGQRGLLLDHLLHDALVDAELLQHALVDVGAVRRPVLLHLLLVDAAEPVAVISRPSTVPRPWLLPARAIGLQEAGDVEKNERTGPQWPGST